MTPPSEAYGLLEPEGRLGYLNELGQTRRKLGHNTH